MLLVQMALDQPVLEARVATAILFLQPLLGAVVAVRPTYLVMAEPLRVMAEVMAAKVCLVLMAAALGLADTAATEGIAVLSPLLLEVMALAAVAVREITLSTAVIPLYLTAVLVVAE